MRIRNRRSSGRLGPLRFNYSGLELTSITFKFFWKTVYLYERGRKQRRSNA